MAPCWRLQFNLSDLYPVPRLGIAQLASVLRRQGHYTTMVDVICEGWSPERFGAWTRDHRADLVGVSATILSVREAFALCRAAKAARPGVKTVVGGPGVGGWRAEDLFRYADGAVDFFVRGEGEVGLSSLVETLEQGGALSDVPSLLWQDDSGRSHENAKGGYLDLAGLPSPAWDLMPMERYRLHPPLGVYPYATILETARGCTYPCNFCCLSRPVRTRPMEWIALELQRLHAGYGMREVHFVDPTFTLDRDRTLACCDVIESLPFALRWTCKTRVDHVDDALAGRMARAGCYGMAFGVESGADILLERMKKKAAAARTRETFRICRSHGIRTIAYCLVAGPEETDETVAETIRFVREIQADYVLYGIVDPDPDNALTRQAISRGSITTEDLAEYYLGEGESRLHQQTITGFPGPRAQGWLKRASSDFYLRPRYMLGRVRDLRTLQDARNLASGGTTFLRDLFDVSRHWRRRRDAA